MANSRADVALTGVWTNAYTATGITVGTAVTINNKAVAPLFAWVGTTAPTSSTAGYQVDSGGYLSIATGASGLWVMGSGNVLIQD